MTRSTIFFAAVAAAVANAATVSFPAYAAPEKTAAVRFGDLNLASATGAATLKARVANAAKRVCSSEGDRSLEAAAQSRACSKLAVARAMPQVELALAGAGTQVAENTRVSVAAH